MRFVVNLGEIDVVAEFTGYNFGEKTRSVTTTSIRSKIIVSATSTAQWNNWLSNWGTL